MLEGDERSAREAGAAAARAGQLLLDNPYSPGSEESAEWSAGWRETWSELLKQFQETWNQDASS